MFSKFRSGIFFGFFGMALLLFAMSAPSAQAQTATLSATSHTFGSVAVSATSGTASVRLTNSGTAALTPVSIAASANFAETNTCGNSVAAGKNCTISITFTPTATGTLTGAITITDNVGTQTITLQGTGTAPITVSPMSHAFGSVALGQTSAAETLTVTNKGTTAASITIDPTSTAFQDANACGSSLAGGSSCTISVTFVPGTTTGHQTGDIDVGYTLDSAVGTIAVAVQGTGVEPITVTPASRALGSVAIGQTSAAKTFTVTNNSTLPQTLTITPSAEFGETDTCGSSVAASGTCTINATFTPSSTASGLQTGTITIADSLGSTTVDVQGTAIAPVTVSPTSIAFSTTLKVGTASSAHTVTIDNHETVALTDLSITVSPASYAVTTTTCTSTLAASSSCTATIVFTPEEAGSIPGTLTISDSAVGSPQTVTMTGTGVLTNLKSVVVTPANSSLATGATTQFTATGTYSNGTTGNVTDAVTWTSSGYASISLTGLATGVSAGSATITAAVPGTTVTGSTLLTVTGAALTSIVISGTLGSTTPVTPPTLAAGTNLQLYATGIYSNGTTQDITSQATWASNTTNATAVGGLITAVSAGDPTITASLSGITGSTSVTVSAPTLVSIAITPLTATVAAGSTQQFTATGTYTDNSTQNITTSVTWSSSAASVTMSTTTLGLATTTDAAAGTSVNINATLGTVSATAQAVLTVNSAALVSIVISGTRDSITPVAPPTLAAGTNLQLYATGIYSDGSNQDITSQATWASNTTNATAVGGLITAVSPGNPTITASLSGITGSTSVTVSAPTLVSIAITPLTATVAAGSTQQFTATGTYTDNSTQNITTSVTWSSSAASVTMSATTLGLATTTDPPGTIASISATLGTVSAATPATLTVGPAALVSVAVTPANQSIALGTTQTFTATGTYTDNSTQDLTTSVTWSAATYSGGGAATFTGTTGPNVAQATAQGVVTITATSGSISGSTSLTVTAPVLTSIVVTSTAPATPPVTGTAGVVKIYQGQTQQFYALGTFSDASIQNITSTVAWSAGTGSVATVSTSGATAGLATGVAAGTVNIVATSGSITSDPSGDGSLTVIGLTSVTITPSNPTAALGDANSADPYGATNNTLQFTATATYADNTTGNVTASATWTSGTQSVATIVGATGLSTLLTAGTSTITATYAGMPGNTLLTVTSAILESITVSPDGVSLGLNGTQQFTATGSYSDGTTADLTQTATWASGNSQVVTVNSTGLATVVAATNVAVSVTASSGTIAPDGATNTAWVSALSTLPIVCQGPTIDMRLLVVNNAEANAGAGYADFPAIQQILNYVGTPYDVVDVSGAAPTLSDGACHAYYQGVIFAYGGDYYSISAWQSALISYEQTFGVRQLNWYDTPDPNFGLSYTGTQIPSTETYTTNFTTAAAPVFFYANTATPLTITNAAVDLATADPAAGGTLTPLLQDASGNIVSAIYTLNGQQFLSQTFDSNPYLTHDLVVAYGLLNWVTNGVFLGDYHVYATQSIDDFFIDDSEWIPSTVCLSDPQTLDRTLPDASNLPVFRVNSADMAQLVTWQKSKQADPLLTQFELTIAMNGVGTSGNGDWTGLTAPIIASSASGGTATFTAPDFSGLVGQSVTVTNTINGGGVLNGTWTITAVTSSAATTPGTTTFTVSIPSAPTVALATEKGVVDNPATPTASVPDDLVANLQNYQQYFHWISHTYNHPTTLTGLCQSAPTGTGCGDVNNTPPTDYINLEILTNLYVASSPGGVNLDTDTVVGPYDDGGLKQLTFTDFNPGNIVTPGVTGLNDQNVPGYMYDDGIRYAVSDTSVATTTNPPNNNGPNPSPNVGIVNSYATGIYEVPRHPNDVFYNVANWADDQAEFDCVYSYYVPPGSTASPAPDPPFNTYNAAQVLDFTSSAFVTNMLMGDMDPEMFHQPDLHFSDNYANLTNAAPSGTIPASITAFLAGQTSHVSSLLSDTYDLTISKYEAVYKLPVLTPTMDQLGVLMQNRNAFNLSGVTASIVGAGTANASITITMPSTATVPTAVIPVTGVTSTGSEIYGGQNISHINMTPGQTITLPLP